MKLRPLCTHCLAAPCSSQGPAPSHPRAPGKSRAGHGKRTWVPLEGHPQALEGGYLRGGLESFTQGRGLLELPPGPDTQATLCTSPFALFPRSQTLLDWGPGAQSQNWKKKAPGGSK